MISRVYIHVLFGTKNGEALLSPDWRDSLFRQMDAWLGKKGNTVWAINGMDDHIHLFFEMNPALGLSLLVTALKAHAGRCVREHFMPGRRIEWQKGFGAYSYAHSLVPAVIEFITKQELYHRHHSYEEEYLLFQEKFGLAPGSPSLKRKKPLNGKASLLF